MLMKRPVPQLDPGSGKTRKAYLWAYRSNDLQPGPRIIVFDYQAGRSGEHARQFLGDWQGHLMVDDYGGYKALFARDGNNGSLYRAGLLGPCAAQVLRLASRPVSSPMALEALQRIAYAVCHRSGRPRPGLRSPTTTAREKSLPALEALHDWLLQTRVRTANGGASAKAMDYTLKRWPALIRYAETGHLPIDNNPVENCIRPIALGKKNWLFAGSERAGQRAAAIQTLLGTAKLNGLDPAAWLKDTLEKLPIWPNSRIDELLPLAPEFIEAIKQNSARW